MENEKKKEKDTFTEEQRIAIDAQGKTIVSASAGSGKTTVMIEKIIQYIKKGGSDLNNIAGVYARALKKKIDGCANSGSVDPETVSLYEQFKLLSESMEMGNDCT